MALLTLAAFSAVAGVLILEIFKFCTPQRAIQTARRRVRAYLLAARLFADDPIVILQSQLRLLLWNARYIALLIPAFAVAAVPLFLAWDSLDALWGRAPLMPGETAVVTAGVRPDAGGPQLLAPAWLRVETPAVRIPSRHEVRWRVRVLRAGSGPVTVRTGSATATRWIEATPGMHYLPCRSRMPAGAVEWIELEYPRASLSLLGVSWSWVVWFSVFSTASALALRRKLRVAF
jgi:hypothetical protein